MIDLSRIASAVRVGPMAWRVFVCSLSAWIVDAADFCVFVVFQKQIAEYFHLSDLHTAALLSTTLFSRLFGSLLSGPLTHSCGNRTALLWSMAIVSTATLLFCVVADSTSFAILVLLRIAFGIGMGLEWTIGAHFLMRTWPAATRPIASSLLQIGYPIAFTITSWIIATRGVPSWRTGFVVAGCLGMIGVPMRFLLPKRPPDEPTVPVTHDPARRRRFPQCAIFLSLLMALYYALVGMYPTLVQKTYCVTVSEMSWLVTLFHVGIIGGAIAAGLMAVLFSDVAAIGIGVGASLLVIPIYVGIVGGATALPFGAAACGATAGGFVGLIPSYLHQRLKGPDELRNTGAAFHIAVVVSSFVPTLVVWISTTFMIGLAWVILIACEALGVAIVLAAVESLRRRQTASRP